MLSPDQGQQLLFVAREALCSWVLSRRRRELELSVGDALDAQLGAFVTLRKDGQLRGCIGQTESLRPLHETVAEMAIAAGTRDPRFSAVGLDELDQLRFEISVLGELQACGLDEVQVGRDGLVVAAKGHRGLLLPEVAVQQGWNALRFVENTCYKAGLPHDAVPLRADLYRFQTQHFAE
jgi:uncharacterized protein